MMCISAIQMGVCWEMPSRGNLFLVWRTQTSGMTTFILTVYELHDWFPIQTNLILYDSVESKPSNLIPYHVQLILDPIITDSETRFT
jgi:hypothetical protein